MIWVQAKTGVILTPKAQDEVLVILLSYTPMKVNIQSLLAKVIDYV